MSRGLLMLLPALLVAGSPKAQMKPGFDPQDVIRQVRSSHSTTGPLDHSATGLDDGEFLIDTSIVYVPATGSQEVVAVASGGGMYLAVWISESEGIVGTRVAQSGRILDPVGIHITPNTGGGYDPAVAFDGTSFLVVWCNPDGGRYDIYGARVGQNGTVLDSEGIVISGAPSYQLSPAVAFDGTEYLVVWQDYRSWEDIRGARVTRAGEVLDSAGILVSAAPQGCGMPAVAYGDSVFFVVWPDGRGSSGCAIYGARVSRAGTVLDTAGIEVSTAPTSVDFPPALAFGGTDFLAVWQDHDYGDTAAIYGARVSQEGSVRDSAGIPISAAANWQLTPAVAFDSANWLVVWVDQWNHGIRGSRVSPDGVVLDTSGVSVAEVGIADASPAVAYGGGLYFTAWTDYRAHDADIYGARLTPAGTVLDSGGIIVSTAANQQGSPAQAFDGTNFLVAWADRREDVYHTDLCAARVRADGTLLDTDDIVICSAPYDQGTPSVAFDGTNFLAVWSDSRSNPYSDIFGARVSPGRQVLEPNGFAVSSATGSQSSPAVAFDGTNFMVVWVDSRSGQSSDIYGARVNPSGTVLDPDGFAISTAADHQGFPAVIFDGTNYLVVWETWRTGWTADVFGARVSPGGVVLDSNGFAISTAADEQRFPAVAFDGTNSLVVWQDWRNGHDYSMIYGARVSPAGALLDSSGIPLSVTSNASAPPAVAFDGTSFLAAWMDERAGDGDICGARVRPDGGVFDSGPIVQQEGYQQSPTLARGPGRHLFLTYQGWAGTVGGKKYDADRIWGKLDPRPGVQEMTKPEVRTTNSGAMIVRGVLRINLQLAADGSRTGIELLDAGGRRAMKLQPGENDVSGLAAGVYFVHLASGTGRAASSVTRIVIAK